MRFTQLQCKEVICISDGKRLGFITDVQVTGPCKLLGIAGRSDDYLIPWEAVRKIGPDIVLVDIRTDECRVPRRKGFLPV